MLKIWANTLPVNISLSECELYQMRAISSEISKTTPPLCKDPASILLFTRSNKPIKFSLCTIKYFFIFHTNIRFKKHKQHIIYILLFKNWLSEIHNLNLSPNKINEYRFDSSVTYLCTFPHPYRKQNE